MPEREIGTVSLLMMRYDIHRCIQLIAKIAATNIDEYTPQEINEIVNAIGNLIDIRKELIIISNSKLQKQSASFDHVGKFAEPKQIPSLNIDLSHIPVNHRQAR